MVSRTVEEAEDRPYDSGASYESVQHRSSGCIEGDSPATRSSKMSSDGDSPRCIPPISVSINWESCGKTMPKISVEERTQILFKQIPGDWLRDFEKGTEESIADINPGLLVYCHNKEKQEELFHERRKAFEQGQKMSCPELVPAANSSNSRTTFGLRVMPNLSTARLQIRAPCGQQQALPPCSISPSPLHPRRKLVNVARPMLQTMPSVPAMPCMQLRTLSQVSLHSISNSPKISPMVTRSYTESPLFSPMRRI